MNGNIIIKNASQLVTCAGFEAKTGKEMSDLHIIEDGAVVIENGLITAVGKTPDIMARYLPMISGFEVIEAENKAVLPGFTDSHTHFVFGGFRAEEFAQRLAGERYMDIMRRGGGIMNTVLATRMASDEQLLAIGLRRSDSMLSFGITTVEGKSGYGLDKDTEIRQLEVMKELDRIHPTDIVRTFMGAHAVPPEYAGKQDEYLDYLTEYVMPEIADRGLAEFCDIFCEQNVFTPEQSRKFLLNAKEMGFKTKIHADEINSSGGAELAAELGAVSADHLLAASDKGIRDMAKAGVVAVLLPGTAFSLKKPYARARFMIDSGCAVALATDMNPGSCFTENISLIAALATMHMNMSIEETITALTINGAAAIDRADSIGSIDVGKKGDVIILEFPSYRFIPYHIGVSAVETVIKNGVVVYDKARRKSCWQT